MARARVDGGPAPRGSIRVAGLAGAGPSARDTPCHATGRAGAASHAGRGSKGWGQAGAAGPPQTGSSLCMGRCRGAAAAAPAAGSTRRRLAAAAAAAWRIPHRDRRDRSSPP